MRLTEFCAYFTEMGPQKGLPFRTLGLLLTVLFVARPTSGSPANPGLKIGVSQGGLDYAAKVAINKLAQDLSGSSVPDVSGKSGSVKWSVKSMKVVRFTPPTSRVVLNKGTGLTWTTSGTSAAINGRWRYKYRKSFIKISDHGSFDASASGVYFSVSVTLGVDATGRPTISSTRCSSNPGTIKVKFHGGASFIYNVFRGVFAGKLKKGLQRAICTKATQVINKDVNAKLATIDVLAPLGQNMMLDYRLTEAPLFGSGFVEIRHKGEVFWKSEAKRPPFAPAPMSAMSPTPKMVNIWLSDYVVNSLLYTAYTHGVLQHNLTKTLTSNKKAPSKITHCFGPLCHQQDKMSTFGLKYDTVLVTLKCTKIPSMHFAREGIKLTFTGEMGMYATGKGEKPVYLVSGKADMKAVTPVTLRLEGNTIKADFSHFDVKITGIYTKAGNITEGIVLGIFNAVVDAFIKPELKRLGNKGIDLPHIKGAAYVQPVLELNKNAILIAADLKATK